MKLETISIRDALQLEYARPTSPPRLWSQDPQCTKFQRNREMRCWVIDDLTISLGPFFNEAQFYCQFLVDLETELCQIWGVLRPIIGSLENVSYFTQKCSVSKRWRLQEKSGNKLRQNVTLHPEKN